MGLLNIISKIITRLDIAVRAVSIDVHNKVCVSFLYFRALLKNYFLKNMEIFIIIE